MIEPVESETLTSLELKVITGYARASKQIEWLDKNAWRYVLTRARQPVVGRLYARGMLGGTDPKGLTPPAEVEPNFAALG